MRKSLKRFSSLLLIVIMIISMSITSWGQSFSIEDFPKHLERMELWDTVILMLDSSKAYVDLTEVAIDDTNKDIKPLLKNNKTLVPVRFISEALGAEVDWNGKTSTITITLEDRVVMLVLGSKEMSINGQVTEIEVPAQLMDNRTFIPLRAISEALGKEVFYDRGLIIISDIENVFDASTEKAYIDAIISMFQETVPEGYEYTYYVTVTALFGELGLEEEALKYADKLIDITSESDDFYIELEEYDLRLEDAYGIKAYLLAGLGKHEEAIVYYDKSLSIDPNNYFHYYSKGNLLYKVGQYEEAAKAFDKAREFGSYFTFANGGEAELSLELGEIDKIVKMYNELAKLRFDDIEWIYEYVWELWELELEEEAIELLDKAIIENNGSEEFYGIKAVFLYRTEEFEGAIEILDEILKKDINNEFAIHYKYLSLSALNKNDEALQFLDRLVKIESEYARYYFERGRTLSQQGNYEFALKYLEKYLEFEPNSAWTYGEKAWIFFEMGKLNEAIEAIDNAIELDPNNPRFYNNRAWYLLEKGHYEEAFISVNNGFKLYGDTLNTPILDTRGWILFRLGEYDKAMQDFEKVIELDQDIDGISSSNYGMACIYAAKNQNEKAIEYLTRTVELDSSYIKDAIEEEVLQGIKNTDEFKALVKKYNK